MSINMQNRLDSNGNSSNPIIAMVLLGDTNIPSTDALFKLYNQFHNHAVLTNINNENGIVTFENDGEMGLISLMPEPIPWEGLEGPCSTAWYWKEATQVLKQHKAHIIVSILPQNQPKNIIDRVMLISKITASVAQATNALGIYWGSGTVVQKTDFFIAECMKMNDNHIPFALWVDFRIQMFPDKTSNLITTGMEALGLMEIEIVKSSKNPMDLLEFTFNIVDYLMKNGLVINDGDTVGEDENQKIKVFYKKSIWNRKGQIMQISY